MNGHSPQKQMLSTEQVIQKELNSIKTKFISNSKVREKEFNLDL